MEEVLPRVTTDDDDPLELVVRLRAGETSALAEAYDRHHAGVRGFARRLLGDVEAAEDLVHDVFVALPRAIRGYRGRAPLRAFLLGIAANLCHRHVRRAVRRRALAGELPRPVALAAPSEARTRAELAAALQRAMDQLPVDQRVAFTLVVVEERPGREVAEVLGLGEVTLRTRVARARERLRAALRAEGLP